MLDAYIIDRIRREQERAQQIDRRLPLQIENPRPARPDQDEQPAPPPPTDERGSAVIDYTL